MLEDYLPDAALEKVAKDSAPLIFKKFVSITNVQYSKLLVNTEICFSKYLKRYYRSYSTIRTLLYRDAPVSLKSHYVQTSFTYQNKEISRTEIFPTLNDNKFNIILGTAGAGKSIFMKRFFLDLVENKSEYIPLLIELRLLKSSDNKYDTILDYSLNLLSSMNEDFSLTQLKYALNNGKIALLLDGFDEIDNEMRDTYTKEILDLSKKYDKSLIVISSRPDESFNSWNEFHILKTNVLKKEEAIELISKINYLNIVKDKFIEELDKNLFEKHIDFTSNPLLLTMMLLTYEQLAEIPEKIHIFYEEVFNTLFHKHDAYKEMYKRKFYTKLAIDDFKKLFSLFCILSYSDKKLSFSSSELEDYIKQSMQLENIKNEKVNNIIKDLTESVCILQKDGHQYTFSHRSFQEYFTAYYISHSNTIKDKPKLLNKIFNENQFDNVLSLLKEMNDELIEQDFILIKLKELLDKLNKIDINTNPYKFLQFFITRIKIEKEDSKRGLLSCWIHAGTKQSKRLRFLRFIRYLYDVHENINKEIENEVFVEALQNDFGLKEIELINSNRNNINNKALNNIMLNLGFNKKFSNILDNLEVEYQDMKNKYSDKKEDLASLLF